VSQVYRAIIHHISYSAADYESKLIRQIYPDSCVLQKMSCGRTKAETLVTDVSGPNSVECIVDDLMSSRQMMPKEFSVATDALNIKNQKMFPVCA